MGRNGRWLGVMLLGVLACAHDELSTGVWVHDLSIEGNTTFTQSEIAGGLATQQTGWWPFAPKKWFDEAAFDIDLRRVAAFYAERGYFDARVTSQRVVPVNGHASEVDVTIVVEEGAPTKIAAVTR